MGCIRSQFREKNKVGGGGWGDEGQEADLFSPMFVSMLCRSPKASLPTSSF